MKILVACEESQTVCIELRKLSHESYSCDVEQESGGHPEWHIKGDVLPLLNGMCCFRTCDDVEHIIQDKWDMIIAFPPCTHLAASGAAWFEQKREDGSFNPRPRVEGDKDWIGNSNSTYKTLGASNHTDKERQKDDFYATDPKAIDILCEVEKFDGIIWECACGQGHLSERLKQNGYDVQSSDLIDRGYGISGLDFLSYKDPVDGNIVTNPPYKYAKEFIEKSIEIIPNGKKVAMFLKLQFLEGKARKIMFAKYPPKTIYVSSSRLLCAKNAKFDEMIAGGGSAVAYCWYVWEKGYSGETVLKWVN